MHLSAIFTETGWDKFPIRLARIRRRFPVSASDDYVVMPVTVDITYSETMRISENTTLFCLFLRKFFADRMNIEFCQRVFAGLVPGHLRIVERKDKHRVLSKQRCERRALIAGMSAQSMLNPVFTFALRMFVPYNSVRPGHIHPNLVGPSVMI